MPAEAGAASGRCWRVAAAIGAVVVLIAAVVWLMWGDMRAPAPAATAGGSDSAAEAALRDAAMRWLAPAASAGRGPASPAAAVGTAPDDEACPAAWRELAGQPADAIDRVFRRLQPQALGRAAALLSASVDPFERIAGRLLAERARQPDEPPPPEAMLALVSEALASPDPRVASLAVQLCASPKFESSGACSSISPQRWAAVDPDNLQAWLAVAAQAQDEGDVTGVREAMARAAQARYIQDTGVEMTRLAASPALQALDPIDREVLVLDMVNTNAALSLSGMFVTAHLCPAGSMGPARVAQCAAIAELLVGRAQTLVEQGIGITIGRRVGWDADRVTALEQEHRAMMEALGDATVFWPDEPARPMTRDEACSIYRRVDAITRLITSDTEIEVARRALQAARAASAAAR